MRGIRIDFRAVGKRRKYSFKHGFGVESALCVSRFQPRDQFVILVTAPHRFQPKRSHRAFNAVPPARVYDTPVAIRARAAVRVVVRVSYIQHFARGVAFLSEIHRPVQISFHSVTRGEHSRKLGGKAAIIGMIA